VVTMTSGAITRYRVLAYITGTFLLILTFVGIPLQIWAHTKAVESPVGFIHGVGYMVYLVAALDLTLRARFSPLKTVLIMLAGTVPFMAFVMERKIMVQAHEKLAADQEKKAAKAARAAGKKAKVAAQQQAQTPEPAAAE
jgi:integral membrane protein